MCIVFFSPSTLPLWSKQEHSRARTKDHREEGGLGVERGDISLLSYESSNSTSGMMLQSLGKPSAQQEDDSIKVLAGRLGCKS